VRGLTVGYGHLVKPGDDIKLGDKITEAQAEAFLESDVEQMAGGVIKKRLVTMWFPNRSLTRWLT
jgi:hypothetical protein